MSMKAKAGVPNCGCLKPIELPDMKCGRCGCRRLGDDLTPEQMQDLILALTTVLADDERVFLRRVKGRLRPSETVLRAGGDAFRR